MFTKTKLALALAISLVAGTVGLAAANGKDANPDRQAEREVRRAKRIAEFDKNKDGKLDASERAAMKQAMAEKRFAKLDTNGDGVISKDEFMAGQAKMGGHHKGKHHKGGDQGGNGAKQP